MPNSAATWVNGFPPLSSKATASRLNSAVNSRLVLLIVSTFQPPQERIKGVHQCEGGSGFLAAYRVAEEGERSTAQLLTFVRSVPMGGKQVHDANLAATMLANGIRRLLTFNPADFRRFESRIELVAP